MDGANYPIGKMETKNYTKGSLHREAVKTEVKREPSVQNPYGDYCSNKLGEGVILLLKMGKEIPKDTTKIIYPQNAKQAGRGGGGGGVK